MADEIREGHFAGEDEGGKAGEQAEQQQAAKHQFECSGRAIEREQLHLFEHRQRRILEQFGDAVLE